MNKREDFHEILADALGYRNVYFQPPESLKINYPCIVYSKNSGESKFANNKLYTHMTRYDVTLIHKDPDSGIDARLLDMPYCSFDRQFTKDNLNHTVFTIYY